MKHTIKSFIVVIFFSCSSPENENDQTLAQPSIPEYNLTVSSGTGGSVSTSGGTYEEGTTVNIPQPQTVNTFFKTGRMDQQKIHYRL